MRQIRLLFSKKPKQNKWDKLHPIESKLSVLPFHKLMDYINLTKKFTLTKMPLILITSPKLIIISKKLLSLYLKVSSIVVCLTWSSLKKLHTVIYYQQYKSKETSISMTISNQLWCLRAQCRWLYFNVVGGCSSTF